MKISYNKAGGSALIVTLMVTAGLGVALASYLKLVEFQNRAVTRSQSWNAAIPASEAGIEEALTHLNKIGDGVRNQNGWTVDGSSVYMARTIGEARYEVWISNDEQPEIVSRGYVNDVVARAELKRAVQVRTTRSGSGMRGLIARGNVTMNGNCKVDSFDSEDPDHSTNGRYDPAKNNHNAYVGSVEGSVTAEGAGVWGKIGTGAAGSASGNAGDSTWMASNTGIQPGHYENDLNMAFPDVAVPFSGGAFNPETNLSVTATNFTYVMNQVTSTTYPDPEPAGGVTTSTSTITSATKPGSWSGTLSTNTSSASTTTYPDSGTYVGNVTTRYVVEGNGKNRTTVTYYDYQKITGYSYVGTVYKYNNVSTNASTFTDDYSVVTRTGNYEMDSLSLSGQSKMLVMGDTVLHVKDGFTMTGQSELIILNGASLTIYVGGNTSLSGNGIMNLNADASKFTYYGLPSNTSVKITGNAAFTGTVYAPRASFELGGGGSDSYDCVGAAIVGTAALNGHFNFHYDERLSRQKGITGFRVASWNEI